MDGLRLRLLVISLPGSCSAHVTCNGEPIWTRTRAIVRLQSAILVHRQPSSLADCAQLAPTALRLRLRLRFKLTEIGLSRSPPFFFFQRISDANAGYDTPAVPR